MQEKIQKIYEVLDKSFPDAQCELQASNPYEVIVSVILSAQCTDKQVNKVTESLFQKYPTIQDMANANLVELEQSIKSCGFYHNKAKNLLLMSKKVVEQFYGKVPEEFDQLLKLPGVGRKTANVVTSFAFLGDALAVDTHVFRVSHRLGIANGNNADKVELELKNLFDKEKWSKVHFLLVLFGRYVCKAKKPECENCLLKKDCKYYQEKV